MSLKSVSTAFILGAGLGTRLRPLTDTMPKPLLPVGGRPMITYAMDHLAEVGVRRFIVNTHHAPHQYAAAFPEGHWRGIPITFRHEPVLLDTAGGLKNIEDLLAGEERLILYNGDILTNLPLGALFERHLALGATVTLALRSEGPLCNVNIDSEGYICDMRDMLHRAGVQRCLFTGISLMEIPFLGRLTAGKIESIVLPLVASLRENPRSIGGAVIDSGFWHDLGTIEDYRELQNRRF